MLKSAPFSVISTAIFIALTLIALRVLCNEQYTKSGIITLHINFTDALFNQPTSPPPTPAPHPPRVPRDPGLLHDFQDGASSALSAAATGIADVVGQAQGALNSVAASIQDIEGRIPHTYSLGTTQFCVGSDLATDCSDLPLNLSSFLPDDVHNLPDAIEGALRERADQITSVINHWVHLSALTVPGLLITEMVLMCLLTIASVCLAFGRPPWIVRRLCRLSSGLRALAALLLGLVLCAPLIALVSVLYVIYRSVGRVPAWVTVDRGEAGGLCIGACACALILAVWTAATPLSDSRPS